MECPIGADEIKKLKFFVSLCSQNPTMLNMPQLEFFKSFIEQLGGKVPAGKPFPSAQPEERLVFRFFFFFSTRFRVRVRRVKHFSQ